MTVGGLPEFCDLLARSDVMRANQGIAKLLCRRRHAVGSGRLEGMTLEVNRKSLERGGCRLASAASPDFGTCAALTCFPLSTAFSPPLRPPILADTTPVPDTTTLSLSSRNYPGLHATNLQLHMDQAARGATALGAGNYTDAIQQYTAALSVNPNAVDYYIKRSTAYQRSNDYQAALTDAEIAVVLATNRAKRELISQAQLRRCIALYHLERYADAGFVLRIVKKLDEKEKSLAIWEKKIQTKLDSLPEGDERRVVRAQEKPDVEIPSTGPTKKSSASTASEPRQTSLQAEPAPAASAAPATTLQTPPNKIKHDWYQNGDNVYLTLLARGVRSDKAAIDIHERSVSISFPTYTSDYEFTLDPLFAPIDVSRSTFNITSSKIELVLKKAAPAKWPSLEGPETITAPSTDTAKHAAPSPARAPTYPTSSRSGPKDWDKVAADLTSKPKKKSIDKTGDANEPDDGWDDLDDTGGDEVNAFFKKLYAGADPDTRRAMMKSYQESNGTALSTNWADVSKGKVETSPPDGMLAKKWGE